MDASQEPRCPYADCQAVLPKVPARKTKCRNCGQFMYFKSSPENRIKQLMTEAQAVAAEQAWERKLNVDKFCSNLGVFGIAPEEFLELGKLAGSIETAYLMLLTEVTLFKDRSFHEKKMAHFFKAAMLCKLGENWVPSQTDGYRYMLYEKAEAFQALQHLHPLVEISYPDQACDECKKLNRSRYSVEELLQLMPLPNLSCTKMKIGEGGRVACNGHYQTWCSDWASYQQTTR